MHFSIQILTLPLLDYTSSQRQKTYRNVYFFGPRKLAATKGNGELEEQGELDRQRAERLAAKLRELNIDPDRI